MIAKLLVLLSVLCFAYITILLGLHVLQLCTENVWMIPVFVAGLSSIPLMIHAARCVPVISNLIMYRWKLFGRKQVKIDLMKEHVYTCKIFLHFII